MMKAKGKYNGKEWHFACCDRKDRIMARIIDESEWYTPLSKYGGDEAGPSIPFFYIPAMT